jgi:two-component system, OmpR family, phosphate regulon sensor histidine kinase PhoR
VFRLSPRLRLAPLGPALAAALVGAVLLALDLPPAAVVALAALAAGGVALLLSRWLGRRLFRPLEQLIAGAGELAAGRHGHRLVLPEADELAALAGSLNRLAAGVEEQIAALATERDHLRSILAGMSEGVLVVDRQGRALLVNPAFRRLFGLTGEVAGKLPLEVARYPEMAAIVDEILAGGRAAGRQLEVRNPERRTVTLEAAALATEVGGGAVVVARDTTEAQRVAAMRRDFLANVSHELKTPLAAIRGYAETLAGGALDEAETARRFTGRILDQCRRLQALLDDLLTLSRLESVELPLERRPVDLPLLIEREIELLAKAAEERQVTVTFEAGEPVTQAAPVAPVTGDASALSRLLANLLDNAIKYNRPGGRVTAALARHGDAAVLTVADTGIGIPADALPRIFERFYRVDKARARDEGGTGLGLAIVKHVAQAHGGRVEVESRMGKGTTFRVILP